MDKGYIYILSNPAMPDLYKIGKTTRDINDRIKELSNFSGVPFPFVVVKVYEVEEMTKTESILHEIFNTDRINPKREFFKLDPIRIIKALELANAKDITNTINQINDNSDIEEVEAGEKFKRTRRPNFNFDMLNIPIGSEIIFKDNEDIKAKIVDDRRVSYKDGEPISLSKLTNSFLNYKVDVAPLPYWLYNGKYLSDIYDEVNPIEN